MIDENPTEGMEIKERAVGENAAEEKTELTAVSRRTFAIGVGSTVALLGLGALKFAAPAPLVRPPGGQDEGQLLAKCNHCNRCIGACPQDIIYPQELDKGFVGMRLPYLYFSRNTPGKVESLKYCDFCAETNNGVPKCVEVCPTGALALPALFDISTAMLGKAVLEPDLCLAYRSGYCAFCFDACAEARGEDHSAIYYVGSKDDASRLPVVDVDLCNGCGACESVCVSVQAGSTHDAKVRAIVVKPTESL